MAVDPLSTSFGGSRRPLARAVMRELRALSTAQDRLDQYGAHRFGLNRTDYRALDLIGQAGSISPRRWACPPAPPARCSTGSRRPATPAASPIPLTGAAPGCG